MRRISQGRAHISQLWRRQHFVKWSSTLSFESEEVDFASRKSYIQKNAKRYYPLLTQLRADGVETLRIPEFRLRYENSQFDPQTLRSQDVITLEGKILSIRRAGKGMMFIDLIQDFTTVQLVVGNKMLGISKEEFAATHQDFRRGDFIVAIGNPGMTKVGELSVKCTKPLKLAAPALHPIPPKLTDTAKRNGTRVADYLVNDDAKQILVTRSRVIGAIRNFLVQRGFLEVQTPIIANSSKGANATPFLTESQHIKDLDGNPVGLQLRVAPELWLKRLVIGGFDKVFEIGPVFRNEGVDSVHNVEFTTCEFYQSFTTLEELMNLTEVLIGEILQTLENSEATREHIKNIRRNFPSSKEFTKYEFIPKIESITGHELPVRLTTESLVEYFAQINLSPPANSSVPQLLDRLSSEFLEPLSKNNTPIFIYNQPSEMSPLAKSSSVVYGDRTYEISRRFELFIGESEYVNAYEEENNPFEQEAKFKAQQQMREEFNDEELIVPDEKYVSAMELGLPPTAGWGLGIDRLCMLLTAEQRIERVLSFGNINHVLKQ